MIKVFGIPHFATASEYSANLILAEKPDIVCVEMHQENLETLIQLMSKTKPSPDEEKHICSAAGDGLVAIIEASWNVGADIHGIEPKKGYDIHKSDYKTGLEGKFWDFVEKSWGRIAAYFDKKGEANPSMYQTSFWASKIEAVRRWIWKHQCFPAYKRVSLERERAYASRLVELERERGEDTKILFFVGGGHKWNTIEEIAKTKEQFDRSTV